MKMAGAQCCGSEEQVNNLMQQIKLFKEGAEGYSQSQNQYNIQQVFQSPKKRQYQQIQTIQPWQEDMDSNPFINVRPKQKAKASPKVRRQTSITLVKQWNSMEKPQTLSRESKKLPVLDVGEFNSIKKSLYLTKIRSKLDANSTTLRKNQSQPIPAKQLTLPSVQRQLSVERKIFLLKNVGQPLSSAGSSPTKSSRLRKFINEIRS